MAYQALYRKYRPRSFSDVVGQEHITTMLRNQIASGHVAHAYLFSGTRGTGKTTTAKILARAVNCHSPKDGSPCEECAACLASAADNPDIVEMDAASNTGVDDMRALMDKAAFLPIQLDKKVYIIDETHMLSQSAFNSLLKTLEEPPAHVMFILATTEPQKVPATILSRCQRLDFRRISVGDIVSRTRAVLDEAELSIDEDGLLAIARASDGSLRDALSLADQCISFCGDHVTGDMALSVLGSVDDSAMFSLTDAILRSDAAFALSSIQNIVNLGRDLNVLVHDLIAHLRALTVVKVCGRCSNMLDCTEDTMDRYIAQAASASHERLVRAVEILMRTQNDMRWLTLPRVLVENAVIRICHPQEEADITALIDRISELEGKIADGSAFAQLTPQHCDRAPSIVDNPPTAPSKAASSTPPARAVTVTAAQSQLIEGFLELLKEREPALWAVVSSRTKAFVCSRSLVMCFDDPGQVSFLNAQKNRLKLNEYICRLDPEMNVVAVHTSQADDFTKLEEFCAGLLTVKND
ncbi:MAG: DNA polymerase III subunit gamma/tau [Clostridia bacterium]|nr:DNA polymerase III subunit gamma/tau [Clostridia bacterium]